MEKMGMEEAPTPCMKGGTGETSYTNNSIIQRSIITKVRPLLEENIRAIIWSTAADSPDTCLTVADLGCSSGPNTLAVLESIIDVAVSTCKSLGRRIPELNMLVNDLPQNDFNTVFKSLPGFYKKIEEEKGAEIMCFVSGTPGSFHGRLFPSKSVHFIHSSTSLHFLSQVPKELKGECICATKGIPPELVEAYKEQFGKDLNMFLRCRSEEIVHGGRMLLTLPCTRDGQALTLKELTNQALNKLASQRRNGEGRRRCEVFKAGRTARYGGRRTSCYGGVCSRVMCGATPAVTWNAYALNDNFGGLLIRKSWVRSTYKYTCQESNK